MKFTIDRKYLLEKLNIVARSISSFSPLPALSGIRFEVENDKIVLTGSDSNVSIKSTILPTDNNCLIINESGSIIIDAKYLLEIVRKLDSETIQFELIDFSLIRISNDSAKFQLNGIPANEYPNIDFSTPSTRIDMKSSDLKAIVSQTAFACSDKDTRPVLTGVNFKIQDNVLYCSATDSYRLARKKLELNSVQNINITVPSKSLIEVVRSLNEEIDEIEINMDAKKAQFIFDNTIIQTRLIDGIFPDVDRIIPSSSIATLVVDSRKLSSVIDRTNFIRNERLHLIKLECSSNETRIKTNSNEIGNSDEILTGCVYTGDDIRLTCNGTFMLEAIRALGSEKVQLDFSGLMKPIRISNPEDDTTLMVVVPIRSYD